jgi:fluoride exporter
MILIVVLLALAGGLGAACRLALDGLIRARIVSTYPIGTTVINVTGSLLLGLVVGLSAAELLPEQWHIILGSGFLGGYTTFSTASYETVRLLQARRFGSALVNGIGMLVLSVAAAALGMWLGSR